MFAKAVFRVAGAVGLLSLPGMYQLPGPSLYYAALAWQRGSRRSLSLPAIPRSSER
jgi:hypothetical protein